MAVRVITQKLKQRNMVECYVLLWILNICMHAFMHAINLVYDSHFIFLTLSTPELGGTSGQDNCMYQQGTMPHYGQSLLRRAGANCRGPLPQEMTRHLKIYWTTKIKKKTWIILLLFTAYYFTAYFTADEHQIEA